MSYKKTLQLHFCSKQGHEIVDTEYQIGDRIQTNLSFSLNNNYYHLSPENTNDAKSMIIFLENWIKENK